MQLEEFKVLVKSATSGLKVCHPITGNWQYKEYVNAFTATCKSSAALMKGGYQVHLWKDENIALLLKLSSTGNHTKIKDIHL